RLGLAWALRVRGAHLPSVSVRNGSPTTTIQCFEGIASSKTRRRHPGCCFLRSCSLYLGPMSDAADLARRFLTLWEAYLAAVLSNPGQAGLMQPWIRAASALAGDRRSHDAAPDEEARQPGPP